MIIDNLTKFNQKKKLWMTPKHPLYGKSVDYKIIYGAVVFMQAEINCLSSPLNNFELERLLISGFGLDSDGMSQVLRLSKEKSIVIDKLMRAFASDREKYLLMLDLRRRSKSPYSFFLKCLVFRRRNFPCWKNLRLGHKRKMYQNAVKFFIVCMYRIWICLQ